MSISKSTKEAAVKSPVKRKGIRFTPDLAAFAYIDIDMETKTFKPEFTALLIEESYRGAYIVMRADKQFVPDFEFKIKPGNLGIMSAKIRWVKKHSSKVTEIGIEYLD